MKVTGMFWKIGGRVEHGSSGEASPTFGHANFSVFIDRIRNQFVKK